MCGGEWGGHAEAHVTPFYWFAARITITTCLSRDKQPLSHQDWQGCTKKRKKTLHCLGLWLILTLIWSARTPISLWFEIMSILSGGCCWISVNICVSTIHNFFFKWFYFETFFFFLNGALLCKQSLWTLIQQDMFNKSSGHMKYSIQSSQATEADKKLVSLLTWWCTPGKPGPPPRQMQTTLKWSVEKKIFHKMFLSDLVTQCFLTFSDTWSNTNLKKTNNNPLAMRKVQQSLFWEDPRPGLARTFFFSLCRAFVVALWMSCRFSVFFSSPVDSSH